jgi:hypothetical protein
MTIVCVCVHAHKDMHASIKLCVLQKVYVKHFLDFINKNSLTAEMLPLCFQTYGLNNRWVSASVCTNLPLSSDLLSSIFTLSLTYLIFHVVGI